MLARALARSPIFYGWVVVAIAFMTMGIGVNARTAFSLLYPAMLDEFGWTKAMTAGAFSVGFVTAALYGPFVGTLIDRVGPRYVLSLSGVIVAGGLMLTTQVSEPWHLHLALGVLVVGVSTILSYVGHSMFLPNWFTRRRGLAVGIAFSGVGVGSILLLPWMERIITEDGWRQACMLLAVLVLVVVVPANLLFQFRRPADLGLEPDGEPIPPETGAAANDGPPVATGSADQDWTIRKAVRTARFWWLAGAFITALFVWYAVQVHQTRYLIEIGFDAAIAAWALGFAVAFGVFGQIGLGYLSDRLGRAIVWTISLTGFALCYLLLLVLADFPSTGLLFVMVAVQGFLGYGITAVYGAIPADLYQGKHYGAIFGTLSLASSLGAAAGPSALGWIYDQTGSYVIGFWLAIALSAVSIGAMWIAVPRVTSAYTKRR